MSRFVIKKFRNQEKLNENGFRVRNIIGGTDLPHLDPFVMLDQAIINPPDGFPAHPHRGHDCITYQLEGYSKHEDFTGHDVVLGPGDLQWLTCGRGLVHSEWSTGNQATNGLQLWVNQPSEYKLCDPYHQELKNDNIPLAYQKGVTVKIVAGDCMGTRSPINSQTPVTFLDFRLQPNSYYIKHLSSDWNALIYVLNGEGYFGPEENEVKSEAHTTLVFGSGNSIRFLNRSTSELRFIMLAGRPLNEPIAQQGPIVMNTLNEVDQAFKDYERGQNGFERVKTWSKSNT
jgi:quercetin 2,3-dioxygenase